MMTIRTSTLLLTSLAAAMLASAYLMGPAPAATTAAAAAIREPARQATLVKPPPAPPASTIKAARAPVPFLTRGHDSYFDVTSVAPIDRPAPAPLQEARASQDDPAAAGAARASIETDGYRNVRGLVKSADGTWRARAMRGSTEIAVVVDPSGRVSAE